MGQPSPNVWFLAQPQRRCWQYAVASACFTIHRGFDEAGSRRARANILKPERGEHPLLAHSSHPLPSACRKTPKSSEVRGGHGKLSP